MDKFTRANLTLIRADIQTALKLVEEKHKVKIKLKNISFDENQFRMPIEVNTISSNGTAFDADRQYFIDQAEYYGLKASDIDKEFTTFKGGSYKITGLNPKANKYPIKGVELSTGRTFKFGADTVKRALGYSAPGLTLSQL